MIEPRFQDEFHSCLPKHSILVGEILSRRARNFQNPTLPSYDIDRCWDIFNEMLLNNEISSSSSISISYNFSETFYDKLSNFNNDLYKQFTADFHYIVADLRNSNISIRRDNVKVSIDKINYYLMDNFETCKDSPEVYLLILKMITMLDDEELYTLDFSNLLKFTFLPVNFFSLTKCSKCRMAYFLNYTKDLRNYSDRIKRGSGKKDESSAKQISLSQYNAIELINIFTRSKNIDGFIHELEIKNVYDSSYHALYNELYDLYTLNEQEAMLVDTE